MAIRLLMFCACERVIIDHGDETITLIRLLEHVNIGTQLQELQSIAFAPMTWDFFTLWEHEASAHAETFEQRIQLVINGEVMPQFEPKTQFTIESSKRLLKLRQPVYGFPYRAGGLNRMILSIREPGGEWEERGHYSVDVTLSAANLPPQFSASS